MNETTQPTTTPLLPVEAVATLTTGPVDATGYAPPQAYWRLHRDGERFMISIAPLGTEPATVVTGSVGDSFLDVARRLSASGNTVLTTLFGLETAS